MKFEYMTVHGTNNDCMVGSKAEEILLNQRGEQGWQLCMILPINQYTRTYYFKREIK